ncbi:MAG: semialdehyde dehydrogenase [Firmicutes bacterium]|nr:semialdehyde dehydrogenase [Bacillota bacterium]
MRVLLCDSNPEFLKELATEGQAEYIPITNPGEAMNVNGINIAVISTDIQEWEFVAQHFATQGTTTFIMTNNVQDINLWKKSSELGCKGVWPKDNTKYELSAKTQASNHSPDRGRPRPTRERLSRTSPPRMNENPAPQNQKGSSKPSFVERSNKEPSASYNSQQKHSPIVAKRELICFFGSNGGVGKTTQAVNTGVAFARQGQSTVVVDFDVFSGDVATRLMVKPTTTMVDWIKGNNDDLSQCLVNHQSGLKILPAPLNHEEGELITAEVSSKILSVLTRRFDVVIVDTAPLLIAPTVVTLEHATKVYILSPPDAATVAKTNAVLKRMDMLNFERYKFKLLVTKMPKKPPFLKSTDMAQTLNLELAGVIPYDEGVQIESNNGTPPVLSRRAKNFSKSVNELCNSIIPTYYGKETGRFNILNLFKRRRGLG